MGPKGEEKDKREKEKESLINHYDNQGIWGIVFVEEAKEKDWLLPISKVSL